MLFAGGRVPGGLLHHQPRIELDESSAAAAGLQHRFVVKAAWTASRIARLPIIGDFQLRKKTSQSVGGQDLGTIPAESFSTSYWSLPTSSAEIIVTRLQTGDAGRLVRHRDELDRIGVGDTFCRRSRSGVGQRGVVVEALETD